MFGARNQPQNAGYFTPREGATAQLRRSWVRNSAFQSTPPARGATSRLLTGRQLVWNFNPRPPRRGATATPLTKASIAEFQSTPPAGGGDGSGHLPRQTPTISIHAPREGGDATSAYCPIRAEPFQSTPPAKGATMRKSEIRGARFISIHAPREGGDTCTPASELVLCGDFNPRPPRGGRRISLPTNAPILEFQSTPPARGATPRGIQPAQDPVISIHAPREGGDADHPAAPTRWRISIHAPREGGDPRRGSPCRRRSGFQSTPPARGATTAVLSSSRTDRISIHAPREGGDSGKVVFNEVHAFISIHAPREGGDVIDVSQVPGVTDFNPRPPRGGRRGAAA